LHSSTEFFGSSKRGLRRTATSSEKVLDRADLVEDLLEAEGVRQVAARGVDAGPPALVAEQPVEAVDLEGEEVGDLEGLTELGEGDAAEAGGAGGAGGWHCVGGVEPDSIWTGA
jgi:hypothetical protein